MQAGEELDLTDGPRQRFLDEERRPAAPAGWGGVGVPPLYNLAKRLLAEGKPVQVVLGFKHRRGGLYEEEFRALGCEVTVSGGRRLAGRRRVRHHGHRRAGLDFEAISMPAARCRCFMHCTTRRTATGSCRSRSVSGADSAPAWVVRAKPNTATNASAKRGPVLERKERSYGRHIG